MFDLKVQYENGGNSFLPGLSNKSVQQVIRAFNAQSPIVITDDYGNSVGMNMSKVIHFTITSK